MNNKELIERYPFLRRRNLWTDELIENDEYTKLDEMPTGWRRAFGEEMCEEILQVLIKYDCVDLYRITQIKEKYGTLRWYCNYPNGTYTEINQIIDKYYEKSKRICVVCGEPATKEALSWLSPYCDGCVPTDEPNMDIEDYWEEVKKDAESISTSI